MEMGVLWIRRWLHSVEGSSILILSAGKNGAVVSLKTTSVGGHTPTGDSGQEDKPWAWGCAAAAGQAQRLSLGHGSGGDPQEPSALLPHLFACICLHTCRRWMFPTRADTYVPVHIDIPVTQYFVICITIAPALHSDFGSPNFFTVGS